MPVVGPCVSGPPGAEVSLPQRDSVVQRRIAAAGLLKSRVAHCAALFEVRLIVATVLTGVTAGLAAMSLALMLHSIQHLAYGFGYLSAPESFLQGVMSASPQRRATALFAAGLVAGFGWWGLARFGKDKVSVAGAIGTDVASGKTMPFFTTVIHAVLQVVTVALGSPLGREVAPREMGTLAGQLIVRRIALAPTDARVLSACGAGAGLAAVYNVPLAGAIFTVEVLLLEASARTVVLALVTSVIATVMAWAGLGNAPQYVVPQFEVSGGLMLWSVLAGPILGLGAFAFCELTKRCERVSPSGPERIVLSVLVFLGLGIAAGWFPELPGNGKGPLQLVFDGDIGYSLVGGLLLLKLLAVAGALRAGAAGGVLTPSMAVGALASVLLGGVWDIWLPGPSMGAYALVGAAAFMGSALSMPLTALVLMTELSHSGAQLIVPMVIATGTAFAAFQMSARLKAPGAQMCSGVAL